MTVPNDKPMQMHIKYDGLKSQLYKLWIIKILLNILTLGFYTFWSQVRIRRYMLHSYSFLQDRFDYTGTGKELFVGFLKALFFMFIFYLVPYFALDIPGNVAALEQQQIALEQNAQVNSSSENSVTSLSESRERLENTLKQSTIIIGFIAYAILLSYFLKIIAEYCVYRYRTNHVRWRGIHFHVKGSAVVYFALRMMHNLINILTLFLWKPVADDAMLAYKFKNLSFGTCQAEFKSNLKPLYASHLKTALLMLPTLGISRFWYRAALIRHRFEYLKFGDLEFRCNLTGGQYFSFCLKMLLWMILTLGLAKPYVAHKRMELIARHIWLEGSTESLDNILQKGDSASSIGEGLGSVFEFNLDTHFGL